MKPLKFFTAAALALLFFQTSQAQQKGSNMLQPPPPNVKVDGDLKDWGDSLRYYNEEKKLNYTLANDKENLYMAIRINDRTEQMRVMNAGLTLSINTKGKKKEMYSITFPFGDAGSMPMLAAKTAATDEVTQEDRDELMRARLTKLRNIRVTGFPDIEGESITTSNTYGIQTALNYDQNGYLVYEAAIPLKFFHADAPDKTEWAFNIKINGVARPEGKGGPAGEGQIAGGRGGMGGGGRGGMGGGGMRGGGSGGMRGGGGGVGRSSEGGSDRTEMGKSVDFWEKFYISH